MRKIKSTLPILLAVFIVSVVIRVPNFDRPLSKHHEFNAAMVLVCMDAWYQNGGVYTAFTSVMSYTNAGDRSLIIEGSDMMEKNGLSSYTSFGSGWFIYPYVFFKMLHITPSPFGLQLFNLLIFAVCFWLCFLIAGKVFQEESGNTPVKSLLTVFLFSFSPAVLWYFGNGYVHEVMVMPFFLLQVYLFILLSRSQTKSTNLLILYTLVSIAGTYCDWLCIFWLFVTFIYALQKVRTDKSWLPYLLITSLAALMGIGIVFAHYGYYFGVQSYFNALVNRYSTRGLNQANYKQIIFFVVGIVQHYITAYFSLLLLFIVWLIVWFAKRNRLVIKNSAENGEYRLTIVLLGSTVILHHVIFPQFSAEHEYAVLKDSLLLSLLSAALLFQFKSWIKPVVSIIFILNIAQYYFINPPGSTSFNGDRYDFPKTVGLFIRKNAKPDEVVFVDDHRMRIQINYYAKRTTIKATSLEEAKKKLQVQKGKSKGIWIAIFDKRPFSFSRFTLE